MSSSNGNGVRAIEPVRRVLLDGVEREFLLSQGGVKRLKGRFEAKDFREVLNKPSDEITVPLLFEALQKKGEMTEDQFAEIVPFHAIENAKLITEICGASFPDRPTVQEVSQATQ